MPSRYIIQCCLKLRPNGLSFHEFRPRFALFPVVGTGRIDVARSHISASVVSRVVAVNSSHAKGRGSAQTASVHPFTRSLTRDLPRNAPLEFQLPQSISPNLRATKPHAVGTRLNGVAHISPGIVLADLAAKVYLYRPMKTFLFSRRFRSCLL
ncbi:hypothetical protein AVEN_174154-1 [Araneus ventricosus]|uniref:Uncharacterized protein n=1 Tax=Araneus ventricosus TaxID=182803 RepID=A0A4Y2WKG4_ARAVE|nr:hypothetical protein AVEN_174154-1 [Araneus ventricosus]